jgi:hypothetical protein
MNFLQGEAFAAQGMIQGDADAFHAAAIRDPVRAFTRTIYGRYNLD